MAIDMSEPIAIVGLDLKFPGDADTPENFYEMLVAGRSALSDIPADRYNIDAFYHPDPERAGASPARIKADTPRINVRKAHFLRENIAAFDAPFFSITPTEASCMDPMQRGLLEATYRALENAGISMPEALGSNTSVYIGSFTKEYDRLLLQDPEVVLKHFATGTENSMLSNKLSWFYNLQGPSITLDTACSSSLNAVHLAYNGLKLGEASMAIVGGCNLFYSPDTVTPLAEHGFLSPDGKCYSFDHRANGYSRGEGFGIVVLKRLSDAIREGNTIRAVIRNTSSNQDGKSPGITQPTKSAQVDLIRKAYAGADIDFASTRYFEAHGTGTAVGDPIEASAISEVFSEFRSAEDPIFVGALKSNIGHLEGAAGVAGLIKAVYVLERGIIPPNLWFEKPNSKILVEKWNFKFPTTATLWPEPGLRRASINSFGFGGSNAHVILDDAKHFMQEHRLSGIHRTVGSPRLPFAISNGQYGQNGDSTPNGSKSDDVETRDESDTLHNTQNKIFLFSSFDENGLQRLAKSYNEHLNTRELDQQNSYLSDLSFTLAKKRTNFPWRASIVANSINSLKESLESRQVAVRSGDNPRLALIFSGQGAQWFAMGRELLVYPIFKQSLEAADTYLRELGCRWSLMEEYMKDKKTSVIDSPEFSQPICTALQVAIVELLHSWSVKAHAIVGHSSGEIAAAFAAGSITRESAWRLAYYRGTLSAKLAKISGHTKGMLSVGLSNEEVQDYVQRINNASLTEYIVVACINSPANVTISGDLGKINGLKDILDDKGIFARKLQVDNAYHSPYMQPIAEEYSNLIGVIEHGAKYKVGSMTKMYSSLTGSLVSSEELQTPAYWVSNGLSPVRFSDAVSTMFADFAVKSKKLGVKASSVVPITELLEIGPHAALRGPLREILAQIPSSKDTSYESVLKRGVDATSTCLAAAGWLYCKGHYVDVESINSSGTAAAPEMLADLPSYPFNHSKTYWKESRISRGYRFRKFPRHELLGSPVPDWNKSNAIWRNWIRLSENPWVKDHRITGSTLYPAAGMLIMALEASRQLAYPEKTVKGFRFKEVVFHSALKVPSTTDGIETHFQLSPYMDSTSSTSSSWSEFQLSSVEGNDWRQHCRGLIQTEYETAFTPIDDGLEERLFDQECLEAVNTAESRCTRDVAAKQLYELLQTVGLNFGSMFQTMSEIKIRIDQESTHEAVVTVKAPDVAGKMPMGYLQPHLIHPTTLDGVLQGSNVALSRGGRDIRQAMVPTSIKEMWVAGDPEANHDIHRLSAKAGFLGLRQAEASLTSMNPMTQKPLIIVEGLISTAVSGGQADDIEHRHLCFNIEWKPDPAFLDHDAANRIFTPPKELLVYPSQTTADIEAVCYMFLRRWMNSHSVKDIESLKPHHQKYVAWMQHQFACHDRGEIVHANTDWNVLAVDDDYFNNLVARLENEDAAPETRFSVAIGKALPHILAGEVDPTEILFNKKLPDNAYHNEIGIEIAYAKLTSYLDILAHKTPDMKILEVGAGIGRATISIMNTLTRHGENELGTARFDRYDFTDNSSSLVHMAQDKFPITTTSRMTFRTLNIENDPIQQGFESEQYDLIIAANVLHVTKNIIHTLKNIRKLLKPGGKLILCELTNISLIRAGFGNGLLPSWWLSDEPYRQSSPLLSVQDWSVHLDGTGFSGVDIALNDSPEATNSCYSILVSTASNEPSSTVVLPQTYIVVDGKSELQNELAASIQGAILQTASPPSQILPLSELSEVELGRKLCIFLADLDVAFFGNTEERSYVILQKMVCSLDGILWLTQGGGRSCTNPDAEIVTGFARTIRAENPSLKFITLSLEILRSVSGMTKAIKKVFDTVLSKANPQVIDNSFHESDGNIFISRLVEANYMSTAISLKTTQPVSRLDSFGKDPDRALTLSIDTPGLLDTLQFDDDTVYDLPLSPEGEVEFKIEACGLNFLDIMVSLGQVVGTDLGVEGSGVVTRVGKKSEFKVGDRICGVGHGTIGTFARTQETSVVKIPDDMSWTTAASLPLVYVTSYAALYDIANIQPGESLLIQAAAGGIGQACIQLAQARGAVIYATVSSIEKRDLLEKAYGIPRQHILSSRDLTFARGIKRLTSGRGVDVIVNSLSGAALRATWDCIAPFGRFVEVGKVDIYASARLNMDKFKNNVSFEFVDVNFMANNDGPKFQRILKAVMCLFAEKKIWELHPVQVYPFAKIQEAFRYMQSGTHSGKIVLEPHLDDKVMVVPSRKPTYQFDANATYVISGGLGGLGRSVARWMATRGARNLILLSRSGAIRATGKELVSELSAMGVKVATPACDVTRKESLIASIETSLGDMPPIKGCIQGSMVLKDGMFENLSLDDFNTALKPKVQASWNLHEALPKDLDFFILLSSASGIVGNRGQSNYNAGNSYQDALARHRISNGWKATALDLGVILSVGFVAENADLIGNLRATGYTAIREEEFHAILEELCNPNMEISSILKAQISLGFQIPETLGIDVPGWMHDPLFKHLHQIRAHLGGETSKEGHGDYSVLLATADSHDDATDIICDAIVWKLSRALNIETQDVDPLKPLYAFGVDSLVAVELRTWLSKEVGAEVGVFDMMGGQSIRAVAALVATRSKFVRPMEAEV